VPAMLISTPFGTVTNFLPTLDMMFTKRRQGLLRLRLS
jgi:hypothetical protein